MEDIYICLYMEEGNTHTHKHVCMYICGAFSSVIYGDCDTFNLINFRNILKTETCIKIFELAIQSPKSAFEMSICNGTCFKLLFMWKTFP